jgi:sialate O-acetylesterase
MRYPNTAMAIASDLGPGIHPTNKSGYGARAARVALGLTYGKKIEYYGPIYAAHKTEGNKVRISFTHVGQGLAFQHGTKLQGFAVAGEDKKFHWADAVIEGNSVVLSADAVAKPVAVRYGWAGTHPWANLFNRDGLPALPFRTDGW